MQTRKENIKKHAASCSAGRTDAFEAGIDILDRARIKKAMKEYGVRFLNKIFTSREVNSFPDKKELYYSLGFSLKEAFWKTLPSKIQEKTFFNDIEIVWKNKNPEIFLHGKKTRNLEVSFFVNKKIVLSYVIRYKKGDI